MDRDIILLGELREQRFIDARLSHIWVSEYYENFHVESLGSGVLFVYTNITLQKILRINF